MCLKNKAGESFLHLEKIKKNTNEVRYDINKQVRFQKK
jgi:hypothetical protein